MHLQGLRSAVVPNILATDILASGYLALHRSKGNAQARMWKCQGPHLACPRAIAVDAPHRLARA
eukprot:1682020-Lingulodinium_polyedra.AAC.1